MTPAELLEELRRECPTLIKILDGEWTPFTGKPAYTSARELIAVINRHRAEAYELGRNEERPRDAIDM